MILENKIINQIYNMKKLSIKALRMANINYGESKTRESLINNLKLSLD